MILTLLSVVRKTYSISVMLPTVQSVEEPHLFHSHCEVGIANKAETKQSMKILKSKLCHNHDLNLHQVSELLLKSSSGSNPTPELQEVVRYCR